MSTRTWSVLSWNVRGINSDKKWDAIRDRVINSNYDIVYLQETKKQSFDLMFIKKFALLFFMLLSLFLLLVLLGDPLSSRSPVFFKATRFLRIAIASLFNFHLITIMILGFYLIFMLLALHLERENFYSGLKTYKCHIL